MSYRIRRRRPDGERGRRIGGFGSSEGSAPTAPAVANQPLAFGALTNSAAGGIAPTNTGGAITSASIDSGDASSHWQISSSGAITPTAAGDTADLSGGPYSLGCTFTNADGSDTATITVSIEADTYSVTTGELPAVIALGSATIDGKTVKGRPNAVISSNAAPTFYTFGVALNFSTGLTVTSYDTANPCIMRRTEWKHIGLITYDNVVFFDVWNAADTFGATFLLGYSNNPSGRSALSFNECTIFHDTNMATQDYAGGNEETLGLFAGSVGLTNTPDLTMTNCTLYNCMRAVTGEFRNFTFTGNQIHDVWSDALTMTLSTNIGKHKVNYNTFTAFWAGFFDPAGAHVDYIQYDGTGLTTGHNLVEIIGNRGMTKDGRIEGIAQGIFIEGLGVGGLASFKIQNNLLLTSQANAIVVEQAASDTDISYNTLLLDQSNLSTSNPATSRPTINSGNGTPVGGLISYNAVPVVNYTVLTETGNYEFGEPVTSNENADYALLFDGTDFGSDNIADFDALVTISRPKTGGALDAAIGPMPGANYVDWSTNTFSPPPKLTVPVDAADGSDGCTGSVDADVGNGTLYWFVSTSATPPTTSTAFKAGTGATDSGSQAVSGTGTQTITDNASLTASTGYYIHYLHENSAGHQSEVSTGDGFTTAAAGTWTEVWTADFAASSADEAGWNGYTIVNVVDVANFSATGGTQIRLTFEGHSTNDLTVDSCYVGNVAASGDAYDADSPMTQILVDGSGSFTIAAGVETVTDGVAFVKGAGNDFIQDFYFSTAANDDIRRGGTPTGGDFVGYRTSDESGTANKTTGYTDATASKFRGLLKIELLI